MFGNPSRTLQIAVRRFESGNASSGLRIVSELIDYDPYFLQARSHRAAWLFDNGRYAEAMDDMRVVAQMRPNDDEALALIGDCLLCLGRHREATEHYLKVLALNPRNKKALSGLLALSDLAT